MINLTGRGDYSSESDPKDTCKLRIKFMKLDKMSIL